MGRTIDCFQFGYLSRRPHHPLKMGVWGQQATRARWASGLTECSDATRPRVLSPLGSTAFSQRWRRKNERTNILSHGDRCLFQSSYNHRNGLFIFSPSPIFLSDITLLNSLLTMWNAPVTPREKKQNIFGFTDTILREKKETESPALLSFLSSCLFFLYSPFLSPFPSFLFLFLLLLLLLLFLLLLL